MHGQDRSYVGIDFFQGKEGIPAGEFTRRYGFWRLNEKGGLHPVDPPSCSTDNLIRCDTLPVREKIRLCQQRIKGQRWYASDLKKLKASKNRQHGIEICRNAIAEEKRRLNDLIYSQIPTDQLFYFEQLRRKIGLWKAINLTANIPVST
jgi:hypothetical protein